MKKISVFPYLIFSILLVCCNGGSEIKYVRNGVHPPTVDSKATATTVIEYRPAPGQYIGEPSMGFTGAETTQTRANEYAEGRLAEGQFISLGGFGGYIIVAFDHSVEAWGKAAGDFTIVGNQFDGNSEPGIVWVMADDNGDGLPNEKWYELKGEQSVTRNYSVAYRRESAVNIIWMDNLGNVGAIERIPEHTQTSYYPQWVLSQSYSLDGSLLASRAYTDPATGIYHTGNYGWGYVDNFGPDMGLGGRTRFFIKNTVDENGNRVNLKAIDFVKIQTAINVQGGGGIGELSTELCEIRDENL